MYVFIEKNKKKRRQLRIHLWPIIIFQEKKNPTKKKILFRRELFWTLELSSFLHSGAR